MRSIGRKRLILPLSFIMVFTFLFTSPSSRASARGAGRITSDESIREIAIVRQSGRRNQRPDVLFRVSAEIAADRKAREKGLSGRERIAEDQGMLFVLEKGEPGAFWMKGMKFPLDLLYFDRQKRLIRILQTLQPCDICPRYPTPGDAAYVLEVGGGTAAKYDIVPGSSFVFTGGEPGRRAR